MEAESEKEKEESAGEYDPEFAVISLSDACAYVPCDDSHEAGDRFENACGRIGDHSDSGYFCQHAHGKRRFGRNPFRACRSGGERQFYPHVAGRRRFHRDSCGKDAGIFIQKNVRRRYVGGYAV